MTRAEPISTAQAAWYAGLGTAGVASILVGLVLDQYVLVALPFALLVGWLGLVRIRAIYLLLFALIPLSTEVQVTSTLGTDLPTEPLMVGLMLLIVPYTIRHHRSLDGRRFAHVLTGLLALHLFWIALTGFTSTVPMLSAKYLVAKLWYVAAFFLATLVLVRSQRHLRAVVWALLWPLSASIVYVLVRLALDGGGYTNIDALVQPIYRNHVGFSTLVTIALPFAIWARSWYAPGTRRRRVLTAMIVLFLAGIYFGYTRACYLAVAAMAAAWVIFRLRLARWAIPATLIVVFAGVHHLVDENEYIRFAPTVKTVTHNAFDDKLAATFEGRDVSSMERVYRWIAGVHMVADRPLTGFGPNGFVPNYEDYTVFIFETWISDNPERSTIHNYYLLVLVEQGIPGLVLFLALLTGGILVGERQAARSPDRFARGASMAAIVSLVGLAVNLVFSDMIEVDKTGSIFFLALAVVVVAPYLRPDAIPADPGSQQALR